MCRILFCRETVARPTLHIGKTGCGDTNRTEQAKHAPMAGYVMKVTIISVP